MVKSVKNPKHRNRGFSRGTYVEQSGPVSRAVRQMTSPGTTSISHGHVLHGFDPCLMQTETWIFMDVHGFSWISMDFLWFTFSQVHQPIGFHQFHPHLRLSQGQFPTHLSNELRNVVGQDEAHAVPSPQRLGAFQLRSMRMNMWKIGIEASRIDF